MKTKIIALTFFLFASISFAKSQTSDHLVFKSVPIDGTLNDYVLKMKQNGFEHLGTKDETALLKGDFAGYKNCNVGVSTLKQNDLVNKIAVIFPFQETWSTLSDNYFSLKEMLTEKYGNPTKVVEKFDTYSEPRDDQSKFREARFDHCKYNSVFQTEKGAIELSIENDRVGKCFVKLTYLDKINSGIVKAKAKDDL